MANPWIIAWTGWTVVVIGWLLAPIISLLVNKLFAYLTFDASKELRNLELDTVPALLVTLRDVEEQRIVGAVREERSRSDLERFDKMDIHLKSALYEAEDILDLVDYLRKEKKLTGDGGGGGCSPWVSIVAACTGSWVLVQRLLHAAGTCVTSLTRRCIDITPAPLLQCVQSLKRQLLQLFGGTISRWSSGALLPISRATSSVGVQTFYRWIFAQLQNFCDLSRQLLPNITTCWHSILSWVRYQRDWSYEQVGMKVNQKDGNAVEDLVPITQRIRLKKQIKGIEDILTSSKRSDLLKQNSSINTAIDSANGNSTSCSSKNSAKESSSKQKEIDELHRSIEQKVFGRDEVRAHICRMLHEGPDAYAASSSTRKSCVVIGIYGIAGSGKSTLAQYICEYENDVGHFNPIMFIYVGKAFSVAGIFRDMLEQITRSQAYNGHGLKSLKVELEKQLKDKRFLLVVDDLWVNDGNQKERDILLDVLNAGLSGSKILVTAQKTDAAEALGAQKQNQISIPDLEENVYFSLFMHHALPDASDDDGQYEKIGRTIANRLHRSPIAAITVGKQLQRNKSISFWQATAKLDVLNKTMGAPWWSYQQLGADIRRCFACCSTFPSGYGLERDKLVRIWIAQGFVKTSNAIEDLEDVGQSYFEKLLTFSFFQLKIKLLGNEVFTVHDLLHELAERVAGSDFFRSVSDGWPKEIPPEGHHLFVWTWTNIEEFSHKILELKNLRTLIIIKTCKDQIEMPPVDGMDKIFERLFMRLTKLRVMIIEIDIEVGQGAEMVIVKDMGIVEDKLKLSQIISEKMRHYLLTFFTHGHEYKHVLSVPACIDQMKHLRYLGFHLGYVPHFDLIFPSTFSKLFDIQTIDVHSIKAWYPKDMDKLDCLRHITASWYFPNIGRLTSLQSLGSFTAQKDQGYGLKQLEHLNKLRGTLKMKNLGVVRSNEEALAAHLADKKELRRLELSFFNLVNNDPDVEAEVLEGLCPSKDLEELSISDYHGSRYPNWMLSGHQPETAPKHLQKLELWNCSQLTYIPEESELFISLRVLRIFGCDWDSLPDNMERLVSLQTLRIGGCPKIQIFPVLRQPSLKTVSIFQCDVLSTTCKEKGHQNCKNIQHITNISIV